MWWRLCGEKYSLASVAGLLGPATLALACRGHGPIQLASGFGGGPNLSFWWGNWGLGSSSLGIPNEEILEEPLTPIIVHVRSILNLIKWSILPPLSSWQPIFLSIESFMAQVFGDRDPSTRLMLLFHFGVLEIFYCHHFIIWQMRVGRVAHILNTS